MSTRRKQPALDDLMNDDETPNRWVRFESLEFYVRKSAIRTHQGKMSYFKPCLMVANVGVKREGRLRGRKRDIARLRCMIAFMRSVEAYSVRRHYAGVYVECVYNPVLQHLLPRFGYRRISPHKSPPCYFKPTASIVMENRMPLRPIDKLQRPSLRRFLDTPDIDRFWLQEQQDNLLMLVRRDRIGGETLQSGLRLTILKMVRYKVDTTFETPTHALQWTLDAAFITGVLHRLENRLAAAGFRELALRTSTVDEFAGHGAIVRDNAAAYGLQRLGYTIDADAAGPGCHVIVLGSRSMPGSSRHDGQAALPSAG